MLAIPILSGGRQLEWLQCNLPAGRTSCLGRFAAPSGEPITRGEIKRWQLMADAFPEKLPCPGELTKLLHILPESAAYRRSEAASPFDPRSLSFFPR
jgi:hypothetical protein